MLKLLNQDKKLIANINNYSELCIESELLTFDSTLSFKYPLDAVFKNDIEEEGYIRNKYNEYVIREVNTKNNELEVYCFLNFEDLEGKFFEHFNTVTTTIEDCLNLAFAGTGWSVATSNISRKRTIKLTNVTSFKILKEVKKVFRAEYKVDTINKKISIFEKIGTDKGTYFIDSLNLKEIELQSNTHDFITRLIVEGKDGLTIESINNNKKYIENFQYSKKIKTYFWKDERYTSKESLKEDAEYKLNELSKPAKSYNLEIIDLAKINKRYKDILDYGLGDAVTLLSKKNKLKEKQRIVKIIEYPHDPHKNSCELANTILTFEDLQQDLQDAADIIDNITTDNGTIDGSTVDEIEKEQIKNFDIEVGKVVNLDVVNAKIENLIVNKADITSLNAVNANIGNLQATKANITDLNATNATISNLQATKADIVDLNVTNAKINVLEVETAKIGVLEGDVANIQDIVNGNLSSENIQTGGITGDRLNMNTIFVNDANIVNVNANKINSGEINTNKVKIKSADGGIEIVGPTQQWKDKNNKVRMQAGKDAQGNFTFGIFDETGTGTLIDHTGIKEKALGSNIIKENMISSDAVGEKQINYNSFATGFNKDTNTSTLKATKVRLDNQNQTLDVAFTSLKSQADGTKTQTESNTTQINVQQGQISTAIANTKIVKDGKEVLLKDDYNTTVATVNSMKNTISSHTTKIDEHTGKITGVESKTNVLERDLNSMSSKISATETTVKTHTTQITTAQNTANSATSKADKAQTDANKGIADAKLASDKVNNLSLGARNYIKNSNFFKGNENWTYLDGVKDYKGKKCAYQEQTTSVEAFIGTSRYNKENLKNITLSFLAAATTNVKSFDVFILSRKKGSTKDFDYAPNKQFILTENLIKYEWVYTIPDDVESFYLRFDNNGSNDGNKATLYISEVKLESGNKATDWTPAIEDTQNQIDKNKNDIITVNTEVTTTKNKVSGIEQNLDSITTRVGSVESTTTTHTATINSHTSSLNAVDGKINTAKTDAINTSKADATTKANDAKNQALSGAATDAQNKANKALNDSKGYTNTEVIKVNSTMTSKFAEIKTTTDSITQTVSNTNREVETVKVNVTNANNKVDNIKVASTNRAIATKITTELNFNKLAESNYCPSLYKAIRDNLQDLEFSISFEYEIISIEKASNARIYLQNTHNGKNWANFGNLKMEVGKHIFNSSLKTTWTEANGCSIGENITIGLRCDYVKAHIKIGKMIFSVGNKIGSWSQAPEDTSKEILDITTEKVNLAKAEIKVTTDSITNRVSNTEQTTITLTTNVNTAQSTANTANSQASTNKNEITKTNSKVASVETSLNGITSRVSNVESTTNTLNGKVNSHESRITSAEQKITPSAIINTVSATIDTKVAVVNTKLTELKQTTENFQMKVEKRGSYNLIRNGDFSNGINMWTLNNGAAANENNPWFTFDGSRLLLVWCDYVWGKGIYQFVNNFVPGETYTLSADVFSQEGTMYMQIEGATDFYYFTGNSSTRQHLTFVAKERGHAISFGGNNCKNFYIDNVTLVKGPIGSNSYIANNKELYSGIIKIDENGQECTFENGTKISMGRKGFYYRTGDGDFEYHALSLVGEARIASESSRYIYLPEVFRGKNLKVICQIGQIGTGTDAISNPKPLISFWAGADDLQSNPTGYAPYFRLYGSTRLRNDDGSIAYRDKEVLITYTVLA